MPTGHVLGLSDSSPVPQILVRTGDAISQTMREIGRGVAQTVERVQTGKQLKAFGEEIAQFNPATPDYMATVSGLASKYPLVTNSDAGKTLMSMLGQANRNFLLQSQDLTNFNQQKELAALQHGYRMKEMSARPSSLNEFYTDKFGRVYSRRTGEIAQDAPDMPMKLREGEGLFGADGSPIVDTIPRTSATPYTQNGGRLTNRSTGEVTQLAPLPMSESERLKAQTQAARVKLQSIGAEISGLLRDLAKETDETRKLDIQQRIDKKRIEKDDLETLAMDFVPSNTGLGGMNPAPLGAFNLNPPSVLPSPQQLPVPQQQAQPPIQPAPESWRRYLQQAP